MPYACTTGRKIGVVMMIVGPMSMKVPSSSISTLSSSSTISGLSEMVFIQATSAAGTFRNAISHEKAAAVPMTSSTIAVVRTAPMVAWTKSSQLIWR